MPDANGRSYVLSLDVGGPWSLLEALALLSIYGDTITSNRLLSRFDLVAANSGGSVIAAALATDRTLPQILGLITDATANYRKKIPPLSFRRTHKSTGIGPEFSTKHKFPALQEIMSSGPKRVADIPPRSTPQRSRHRDALSHSSLFFSYYFPLACPFYMRIPFSTLMPWARTK